MEVHKGGIVVLGLGNPLLTDDRVGLAVAEEISRLLEKQPVPNVVVAESTRGGFELIDLLSGYERAIIIDCLTVTEPQPGRIHKIRLAEARGSVRLVNPHEIGIYEAFALAKQLGIPMPEEVEIYGVEGADTCTLSERMTPEVERVVPVLARHIWASVASGGK